MTRSLATAGNVSLGIALGLSFMNALGDRLVIMVIVVTGLAGLFAFWGAFIEGVFEGWLKWILRGAMIILFIIMIIFIWRFSRTTRNTQY